jgi:hypothetical protein
VELVEHLFQALSIHSGAAIRDVGQAGLKHAQEHLQRAQRTERREAVYGR